MRRRVVLPVLVAAALAGCLPEGRPVDGRQLFKGRSVENPSFIAIDKVAHVLFEVRTAPAQPPRSAVHEQWLVNYDTGATRLLLANVADRDSWRPQADKAGVRFAMVDERFVDGGSTVGISAPVGTLVRLDLSKGELERIQDVSSFSVQEGGQFFYRTVAPGSRAPELWLRTMAGASRSLGPSAGAAQLVGPDRMYFVGGEERTLSRITSADAPVEVIRTKVTRFLLSDDEKWAVLQVTSEGKPQAVVLDLTTKMERALPGTVPCCWRGFSGPEFLYSESAAGATPGKLHAFNVSTGTDRVVNLPRGLADLSSIVARPNSSEALFLDSQGRLAVVQVEDPSAGRVLDIRPLSPAYSDDGGYLVYVEPDPTAMGEGRLMVQDADFKAPPRAMSPPGSVVPPGGYFFIADGTRRILVFWAHFGRNASDLYFGNHLTGDLSIVASRISQVTVTSRRVFGIVRVSEQDLVGELVNKDLIHDQEVVLAHSVADATAWGARVAFVIRERIASPNDGLWAIPIEGINGMTTKPMPMPMPTPTAQ
jgi:hypothetical protein